MKNYDFPLEKGLEIQTEQLNDWRNVLKPEYFDSLVEFALEKNHEAKSGMQVCRGSTLTCFVTNMSHGSEPIRKKTFKVGDVVFYTGTISFKEDETLMVFKLLDEDMVQLVNPEGNVWDVATKFVSKIKLS